MSQNPYFSNYYELSIGTNTGDLESP